MKSKIGIYILLGVILAFMVLHLTLTPETISPRAKGATMLGGIAFLLMSTSVVLTTRLDFLENMFGGLDRMYQVHRVSGVVAAIFVLIHFVGVPKNLPEGVDPIANAPVPSAPMGMVALVFLMLGLFMALNRKISYSRWRPAHKMMAVVYFLVIGHFMTAPSVFFERFSASGSVLILAAIIGLVALFYTLFGMHRRTAHPYTIESVHPLERATELVLAPIDKGIDYKAGQFAFIEVRDKGWNEPHPFTISSAPSEDNLRFTIKVLGDWTRKVRDQIQVGKEVYIRGPYGRFNAQNAGNKQIWIAGGIGITPFLSKIRDMKEDDPREVHLHYAARDENDALFLDELKERIATLNNVELHWYFSNDGDLVTTEKLKVGLSSELAQYEYFMCGPTAMINGLSKELKKEGVSKSTIHREAFEFR